MSSKIDWSDTIKKEAEGVNGEDFGEVQDVSNGFVVVQRGIINKDGFLIPQDLAESYDGDIVYFFAWPYMKIFKMRYPLK